MAVKKPWDRLPAESKPAWEAFEAYRDSGAERAIRPVAKRLGKSSTILERWSVRHGWVGRAGAYDAEMQRYETTKKDDAEKHRIARKAERWANRLEELDEILYAPALQAGILLNDLVDRRKRHNADPKTYPPVSLEDYERVMRMIERAGLQALEAVRRNTAQAEQSETRKFLTTEQAADVAKFFAQKYGVE